MALASTFAEMQKAALSTHGDNIRDEDDNVDVEAAVTDVKYGCSGRIVDAKGLAFPKCITV